MSVTAVNGRSRTPLELSPPEEKLDPTVTRSLAKLAGTEKYAKATRQAEQLVRDQGLTLDIERLRDRVERRFAGLDRVLLSQPGVLHRLVLDALEADDLQRTRDDRGKEREEREKRRAEEAAARRTQREEEVRQSRQVTESLMKALTDVIAANQDVVSTNQAMLKELLGRGTTNSAPPAAAAPRKSTPRKAGPRRTTTLEGGPQ